MKFNVIAEKENNKKTLFKFRLRVHRERNDYVKYTIGLGMRDIYERKFTYIYMTLFIFALNITA